MKSVSYLALLTQTFAFSHTPPLRYVIITHIVLFKSEHANGFFANLFNASKKDREMEYLAAKEAVIVALKIIKLSL